MKKFIIFPLLLCLFINYNYSMENQKSDIVESQNNVKDLKHLATIAIVNSVINGNADLKEKAEKILPEDLKDFIRLYLIQKLQNKPIKIFKGHKHGVTSIAISADSKFIVSGSTDNTAMIWDTETGSQIHKLEGQGDYIISVRISCNDKFIITKPLSAPATLWNAQTGEKILNLGYSLSSLAISGNNKFIVISTDNVVIVLDAETGTQIHELKEDEGGSIKAIAISSDNKFIIIGYLNGTITIWDAQTGNQIRKLEGNRNILSSIAISADNKFIVAGSNFYKKMQDGFGWDRVVIIWDIHTGRQIHELKGIKDRINSMAISSDNKFIVIGDEDIAIVWDIKTGDLIQKLEGHRYWITSVEISSNNKYIVTRSWDDTVIAWDVQTGTQIFKLEGYKFGIRCVTISPDNKFIITGHEDQTVKIWPILYYLSLNELWNLAQDIAQEDTAPNY